MPALHREKVRATGTSRRCLSNLVFSRESADWEGGNLRSPGWKWALGVDCWLPPVSDKFRWLLANSFSCLTSLRSYFLFSHMRYEMKDTSQDFCIENFNFLGHLNLYWVLPFGQAPCLVLSVQWPAIKTLSSRSSSFSGKGKETIDSNKALSVWYIWRSG